MRQDRSYCEWIVDTFEGGECSESMEKVALWLLDNDPELGNLGTRLVDFGKHKEKTRDWLLTNEPASWLHLVSQILWPDNCLTTFHKESTPLLKQRMLLNTFSDFDVSVQEHFSPMAQDYVQWVIKTVKQDEETGGEVNKRMKAIATYAENAKSWGKWAGELDLGSWESELMRSPLQPKPRTFVKIRPQSSMLGQQRPSCNSSFSCPNSCCLMSRASKVQFTRHSLILWFNFAHIHVRVWHTWWKTLVAVGLLCWYWHRSSVQWICIHDLEHFDCRSVRLFTCTIWTICINLHQTI